MMKTLKAILWLFALDPCRAWQQAIVTSRLRPPQRRGPWRAMGQYAVQQQGRIRSMTSRSTALSFSIAGIPLDFNASLELFGAATFIWIMTSIMDTDSKEEESTTASSTTTNQTTEAKKTKGAESALVVAEKQAVPRQAVVPATAEMEATEQVVDPVVAQEEKPMMGIFDYKPDGDDSYSAPAVGVMPSVDSSLPAAPAVGVTPSVESPTVGVIPILESSVPASRPVGVTPSVESSVTQPVGVTASVESSAASQPVGGVTSPNIVESSAPASQPVATPETDFQKQLVESLSYSDPTFARYKDPNSVVEKEQTNELRQILQKAASKKTVERMRQSYGQQQQGMNTADRQVEREISLRTTATTKAPSTQEQEAATRSDTAVEEETEVSEKDFKQVEQGTDEKETSTIRVFLQKRSVLIGAVVFVVARRLVLTYLGRGMM